MYAGQGRTRILYGLGALIGEGCDLNRSAMNCSTSAGGTGRVEPSATLVEDAVIRVLRFQYPFQGAGSPRDAGRGCRIRVRC